MQEQENKKRRSTSSETSLVFTVRNRSEVSATGSNVLLMNGSGNELGAVEPHHGLQAVAVGPESVEYVVRAGGDISVVTEEATAESIARADRVSGGEVSDSGCEIGNHIIGPLIVVVV